MEKTNNLRPAPVNQKPVFYLLEAEKNMFFLGLTDPKIALSLSRRIRHTLKLKLNGRKPHSIPYIADDWGIYFK